MRHRIIGVIMATRFQKDHDIHIASLLCFSGLRSCPMEEDPMNTNPTRRNGK